MRYELVGPQSYYVSAQKGVTSFAPFAKGGRAMSLRHHLQPPTFLHLQALACIDQFRDQPRPSALSNLDGKLAHGFRHDRAAFALLAGALYYFEQKPLKK